MKWFKSCGGKTTDDFLSPKFSYLLDLLHIEPSELFNFRISSSPRHKCRCHNMEYLFSLKKVIKWNQLLQTYFSCAVTKPWKIRLGHQHREAEWIVSVCKITFSLSFSTDFKTFFQIKAYRISKWVFSGIFSNDYLNFCCYKHC